MRKKTLKLFWECEKEDDHSREWAPPSQGLTFCWGEITRAIMALFHFLSQTHSIIVGLAITATSLSEKGRPPGLTDDQKYCLDWKSIARPAKALPGHQKSFLLHHLTRYFDVDISDSSSGQIPPHYGWNNDKTRSNQNTTNNCSLEHSNLMMI